MAYKNSTNMHILNIYKKYLDICMYNIHAYINSCECTRNSYMYVNKFLYKHTNVKHFYVLHKQQKITFITSNLVLYTY